tara:strand:+ start:417 stop:662 length:246 start_codon:yes stop_codon:yes gene_type:complete
LTISKSQIHGLGLFSTQEIDAGVCLGITHIINKQDCIRTPLGGFVNHSEQPNCFIIEKKNKRFLYTIRKIRKEELTVYYRF